jgi:hypothetical protein
MHDAHAEFLLDVLQQFQDLRLDGDVQRRGRLVGDQHLSGRAGERHGDHHALAHAARQLVGVFVEPLTCVRDAHPDERFERLHPRAARAPSRRWRRTVSTIWWPILSTGFSAVIGSWKIIAIFAPRRPRTAARWPQDVLTHEASARSA